MHDRNWATPIPLARQAPVTQTELGHTVADTVSFTEIHRRIDGIFACLIRRASEALNIGNFLGLQRNKRFGQFRISVSIRQECSDNRQAVFRRKFKVARVMRRATKNRASTVIHQDKVGDIDRQFPAGIKRMAHSQTSVIALFVCLLDLSSSCATFAAVVAECSQLGVGAFQFLCKRMIWRNANKRRTH